MKMIYFDNAATGGFKPQRVIDATENAMRYLSVNAGHSGHKRAVLAEEYVYKTRKLLQRFFNAEKCERVIFTKNCTEALNTAIFGLINHGNVVVSTYEHNSVLRPLYHLQRFGKITLTVVEPKFGAVLKSDIERALTENTTAHLARSLLAVDKHHANFLDFKTKHVGGELHLYLESVAFEAYVVEVNGFEHFTTVALESRCGVVYLQTSNYTHILAGEIAHQHTAHRPVHHVDTCNITASNGKVVTLIATCVIETWHIRGSVTEVSIHFKDKLIFLSCQSPFETSNIGCAQSEFSATLYKMEASREAVLALHTFHYFGCSVGRTVVNDQNIIRTVEVKNCRDNITDVLLLVVSRNDNNTV